MLPGNLPDIFLDTDVSFDLISKRDPFFAVSKPILELAAKGDIHLLISESSLANLFYLTFDIYKLKNGKSLLVDFISACTVVSGGKLIGLQALASDFKDKEDALQYYTALGSGADYFVTRNKNDFKSAKDHLPILSPQEFLTT